MLAQVMDIAMNIPIDLDLVENCLTSDSYGMWTKLRLRGEVPIGTGDRLVVIDTGCYPLYRHFLNLRFALPKDSEAFLSIGRGPSPTGQANRGNLILYFMNPGNLVPHADLTRSFMTIKWDSSS